MPDTLAESSQLDRQLDIDTEGLENKRKTFNNDYSDVKTFYNYAEACVNVYQRCKAEGLDLLKVEEFARRRYQPPMERIGIEGMNDTTGHFQHEPLTEPLAIRLLLLHKGQKSDALEGSIRHSTIGPMIDYDAVSYAWGTDTKPCSMLLNGHHMPLTQSLYDALNCLRRRERDRIIWADGICIDQTDDVEKSAQVALMPRIFDQARVWVYLGTEADDSELVPAVSEKLYEVDHKKVAQRKISDEELPSLSDKEKGALLTFLHRPWFRRLWVIPEVVVAKDVRFLCGKWEMEWKVLLHVAEIMSTRHETVLHLSRSYSDFNLERSVKAANNLGMILGMRLSRSSLAGRIAELERCLKGKENVKNAVDAACLKKRDFIVKVCIQDINLWRWLQRMLMCLPSPTKPANTPMILLPTMFMHSEVTKPQDRLYALAGLAGDIDLKIFPPDYGESTVETNARLSRKLVEYGQGMDVLYHATNMMKDSVSNPSWAADWISPRSINDHWLMLGWAYKGEVGFQGRRTSKSLVTLIDDTVLRVSGHRLDAITGSIIGIINLVTIPERPLLEKFSIVLRDSAMLIKGTEHLTSEAWLTVWAQTLDASEKHRPEGSFAKSLRDLLQTDPRNLEPTLAKVCQNEQFKTWFGSITQKLLRYSVCKSSKGFLCLVPYHTMSTDVIFMLEGSDMPFVLRPIIDRPRYHTFVGGCYVHGLMNGKAWDLDHKNDTMYLV